MSAVGEILVSLARHTMPRRARHRARLLQRKWHMVGIYGGIRRSPGPALRYLFFDHELDNFTYPLANVGELAEFIAASFGITAAQVMTYVTELEDDPQLSSELYQRLQRRGDRNPKMPFGRRIGWYAVARIVRPRLIVETGVHDGLGSTALLQALEMNDRDGSPGELISFEVDAQAGWLIPERLRTRQRLVVGDSLVQLPIVLDGRGVDMFIHDSDHRYEHEAAEFEAISHHLNPRTVLISDNAHGSTAFADFCDRRGFAFRFWRERPLGHFYPGAGIGLAVLP